LVMSMGFPKRTKLSKRLNLCEVRNNLVGFSHRETWNCMYIWQAKAFLDALNARRYHKLSIEDYLFKQVEFCFKPLAV